MIDVFIITNNFRGKCSLRWIFPKMSICSFFIYRLGLSCQHTYLERRFCAHLCVWERISLGKDPLVVITVSHFKECFVAVTCWPSESRHLYLKLAARFPFSALSRITDVTQLICKWIKSMLMQEDSRHRKEGPIIEGSFICFGTNT